MLFFSVELKFCLSNGERKAVKAKIGDNLLDVIIDNDLDISGFGWSIQRPVEGNTNCDEMFDFVAGACEGTLACSTCHLIFSEENFESIPGKASDEELDMLDLAYALTDT